MRIGVLGVGAVGGVLAALLADRGNEIVATTRAASVEELARDGIRLSGVWGEHTAKVAVGERLTGAFDLVLVTTKAMDAEQAILDNLTAIGNAPVLVVQNGLDGVDIARRPLPGNRVLGGLALFAASLDAPGRVRVTAGLPLYVGPADSDDPVVAALGEALPTRATSDLRGMQWTKLVINQVNALPAIVGRSVQELVADPVLRRILARSIQETVRTGHASGVRFGAMQGLSDPLLRAIALAPAGIAEWLPHRMARRMGDVPNPGSTLQSIRRGKPTEVDALNGAVVRSARALGRQAPVNAALTELVHEVETTGRHLSSAEVAGRIRRTAP